jgi:hypothetical protein
MASDPDWIDKMTWQDWIDRAALREQMTARLAGTPLLNRPGICLCSLVDMAVQVRWEIEFRDRLQKRAEPAA